MKYEINQIFRDDTDYINKAIFCNENGFMIVEIEPDEIGRRFQIQEVPKPTDEELNQVEMQNLINWFNDTYTYKEQKYRRLIALNKSDDDGISASEKLNQLYDEAEEKRARIQELEKLLGDD